MPRFIHDCTDPVCCLYAGETLHCDVYITRSGGLMMRDGDDGPRYRSSILTWLSRRW